MKSLCDICGNTISPGTITCMFCGARQEDAGQGRRGGDHRVINIEAGMPLVAEALRKLESEIARARGDNIAVVTVIHGYGSSGKGGVIRTECRKTLDYFEKTKKIRCFIPGERFSKKEGRTRALLQRLPRLAMHGNLNRGNKGITIVEL